MTIEETIEDLEREIRDLDNREMTAKDEKEKAEIRARKASRASALAKLKRRFSRTIEKAVLFDE